MRISRRTSGGRGEYEISEQSPEGLNPTDLLGRRLSLALADDWQFDTGTTLTRQGGKRRLRMLPGVEIHLHRQVAAALMMPYPVRADQPLGRGAPVLKADQYAIEHIELNSANLVGEDRAVLAATEILVRNRTYLAEELHLTDRIAQLRRIWGEHASYPAPISSLLEEHRHLATSGDPIPGRAEKIVEELQRTLSETGADLGILFHSENTDVIRPLKETLDISQVPPEPPIAVEEVDPEEVEIRRRTVKEWKRWANSRGAASAKFRHSVREAYRSTCIVCGVHLPVTNFNATPGVDAAHILPWSDYDLDETFNGLCLCKLHHWAFDEGLIVIRHEGGRYLVEVPEDVIQGIRGHVAGFSVEELLRHAGPIPEARLPARVRDRPRPELLEMLRRSV